MSNNKLQSFVEKNQKLGHLVVQPRMGFSSISKMAMGLKAVKLCNVPSICTITLDSYTRVNDYEGAKRAMQNNEDSLNGYPIVTYGSEKTSKMVIESITENYPIQVRHGTAFPFDIFKTLIESNIDSTEGGPVSYCLPYSRISLKKSIENWKNSILLLASATSNTTYFHVESFAGCMMGQLCPPSLLIALCVLECVFFKRLGIKSVSLSYTQGTNASQDLSALIVLRELATKYLKDINWHVVFYTYMGVFPETLCGALQLIKDSAQIASVGKCERIIVKTPVEALRIPTIEENIASLEMVYASSEEVNQQAKKLFPDIEEEKIIYEESKKLIDVTLNLNEQLDVGLYEAFKHGYLDIPYCLHVDNHNEVRGYIDNRGYLKWFNVGKMPINRSFSSNHQKQKDCLNSNKLLRMLKYVQHKYDNRCETQKKKWSI